jgi:capsular polysaccharide biosynthesis protein
MSTTTPTLPDDDWEVEQEVDFRRYWDGLVARWWLPVLGLVVGAIIGYAVSLGGGQTYKAQATVYLGQPYSASGNVQLQNAQTNPSTVRTIVNSQGNLRKAASFCKLRQNALRGNVSIAAIAGSLARLGQAPNVGITVQVDGPRKAACAANYLARAVVEDPAVAGFARRKVANFRAQIASDQKTTDGINKALTDRTLSSTDQLLLQLRLQNTQADKLAATQLLAQAQQVESPRLLTKAAAQKVTARSRRNSVVVAAVIGLIVGILAALLAEAYAARAARREQE